MSQQQGGPQQPGYNPHAVGAAPGGQPDPSTRLLGVVNDANVGTGMALNNLGPLKGNVPITAFQDKGTGFKDQIQKGLGIRTRVQFVGFDNIQPAEMASKGHDGAEAGGPPPDVADGLGLGDSQYEQSRQTVFGSKHAHKSLHNQMPGPTEFISPLNLNPTQTKKIYGESDSGGGGGGGNASYEQIYGAGVVIYQQGAVHMGFTPEYMLGGLSPPDTPGMSRGRDRGKSDFGLTA